VSGVYHLLHVCHVYTGHGVYVSFAFFLETCRCDMCLSSQSVSQVTARFPGLDEDDDNDDSWGPLILMGMTALNATVGLTRSTADPFSPTEVPLISVLPPTPDTTPKNANFEWDDSDMVCLPVRPAAPGDAMSQVSGHCAGLRSTRFVLKSEGGSTSITHIYSNRSMILSLFNFTHSIDSYTLYINSHIKYHRCT